MCSGAGSEMVHYRPVLVQGCGPQETLYNCVGPQPQSGTRAKYALGVHLPSHGLMSLPGPHSGPGMSTQPPLTWQNTPGAMKKLEQFQNYRNDLSQAYGSVLGHKKKKGTRMVKLDSAEFRI